MSEEQRDAEEQVEDLDVPESESEDVKGGAFNATKREQPDGIVEKVAPGRISSFKIN